MDHGKDYHVGETYNYVPDVSKPPVRLTLRRKDPCGQVGQFIDEEGNKIALFYKVLHKYNGQRHAFVEEKPNCLGCKEDCDCEECKGPDGD